MEDEIINEDEQEKPARPDNRFKDLSDKVKTTAEERDAEKLKAEKAEADKNAAKKDVEFYKNFNTTASKHPGATDYQDQIKEKVDAGYELEDATVSVLAREGKLTNSSVQRDSPAGGSAATAMKSGGEKELSEMTRDEKRAALEEVERESGGVSQILRRGL